MDHILRVCLPHRYKSTCSGTVTVLKIAAVIATKKRDKTKFVFLGSTKIMCL